MEKIASGRAFLKPYDIYCLSGTVESVENDKVTEVSGSISGGGGGGAYMGGHTRPVKGNVSSETTTFQTIFVKEENGKETVVKFKDFTFPCKEGHKVTLFAVNENNQENGYFKCYNHNTAENYTLNKAINDYMFPWFIMMGAGFVVFGPFVIGDFLAGEKDFIVLVVSFVFLALITAAVMYIPSKIFAKMRAVAVTKNADFKKYIDGVRS